MVGVFSFNYFFNEKPEVPVYVLEEQEVVVGSEELFLVLLFFIIVSYATSQ